MPSINFAPKLPPTALIMPAGVVALASVLLVAILLVQGRALHESTLAAQPPPTLAAGGDAPLPPVTPRTDVTRLANSDLFGHFDPAAAAPTLGQTDTKPPAAELDDKAPAALPEATLALKLQGILYQPDPAQRRAIIAGDGPNPEARKIGETLLGDAVIRFIEARRVVVEQQGELKALSLIEPVLGHGGAPAPGAGALNPLSSPSAFVASPPQSVRRGAIEAMPQPQPYEAPEEVEQPAPEEFEGSAQDDANPPADAVSEPDQSEPTE